MRLAALQDTPKAFDTVLARAPDHCRRPVYRCDMGASGCHRCVRVSVPELVAKLEL